MNRLFVKAFAVIVVATLGGTACGASHPPLRATPVTASPVPPAEEQALRTALVGRWHFKGTVYADGVYANEGGSLYFGFRPEGVFEVRLGFRFQSFRYHVEGRNLVTDHPGYQTMRIESVSPTEIRLFSYGMTVTWVMEHVASSLDTHS